MTRIMGASHKAGALHTDRCSSEARMKPPCPHCPFREASNIRYDADAMEALRDGLEPRCHCVVGMDSIFAAEPTELTACRGYLAWIEGQPGYREPRPLTV